MKTIQPPRGITLPWLSLTLAGLVAALFAAFGPAPTAWVYDRFAIVDGEWWRLLSGHWVHSDGSHLIWNLAALLALGWIIETRSRYALFVGLLGGSIGVDLVLWLWLPEVTRYCGMSGVLNTLWLFALATLWRGEAVPVLVVTGILSFAKILIEISAGQALLTNAAWASVPQAHLAGWLTGLVLIVVGLMVARLATLAADWIPGLWLRSPNGLRQQEQRLCSNGSSIRSSFSSNRSWCAGPCGASRSFWAWSRWSRWSRVCWCIPSPRDSKPGKTPYGGPFCA